jgi:hypothetical protein
MRKLGRAEYALSLSNNIDETINHLVNDTYIQFTEWYTSLKELPIVSTVINEKENKTLYKYSRGSLYINDKIAITISSSLSDTEKVKIESYLRKIAESLNAGYEPAIIPVYDNKEASALIRLRDKNRQSK